MQIPPQPTPIVWGFDHTEDGSHVVAMANTPLGNFVFFIEVKNIDAWREALAQQKAAALAAAGKTESGIEVPGQVLLDAHGAPLMQVPPSEEVQEAMRRASSVEESEGDQGDDDNS